MQQLEKSQPQHATNSFWQLATNREILSISATNKKNVATNTLSKYLNTCPQYSNSLLKACIHGLPRGLGTRYTPLCTNLDSPVQS